MKTVILLLTLVMAIITDAKAQNNAMYVYRNDGAINAFFKDEVDSLSYSHYDTDSIYHQEWMAQLIHTKDSIYYIPLGAIDSISFVTPEKRYSTDVLKMDEIIPYLKSVNGMTLSLIDSTPSNLLPKVGDVLLYENFDNPLLPQGFAGRVHTLDANVILCDSVSLSEIYDQLICFGIYSAVEDNDPASGQAKVRFVPKKIAGNISTSIGLHGSVGSMNSLFLSLDGSLNFDVRIVSKIKATESPYIDVSFSPVFTASFSGSIKGSYSKNILENKVKVFGMPIPDTPFYVYISSGPIIEPSLEASVTVKTDAYFGFKLGMTYQNDSWNTYGNNLTKGFTTPEITGSINGSVFTGVTSEVGISSYGGIIKLCIEKKLGVELSANFEANLLNSNKYEELSKAKVDLDFVASISANALFNLTKWIKAEGNFNLFSTRVGINTWKLLPSFSTPNLSDQKPTSARLSVIPSGNLLQPVTIGIALSDKNDNMKECNYFSPTYRLEKDRVFDEYSYTFDKLKPESEYVAIPMVKWNGIEIKATPTKNFRLNSTKAEITNFKVTKSSYGVNAYYYAGVYYNYKFDVAVTVEIESLDGVEDWGYVYEDIYGWKNRISLMGNGSSYTDTRYAYYRGVPESRVYLWVYVKYEGDSKYYYGESKTYPLEHPIPYCPDSHHPHAIDLGLPSGTKWCCMNVGATSPEGYGGFYAWGETSEKSSYSHATYAYFSGKDLDGDGWIEYKFSVKNIGSDIAGTSYDAATVNMGSPWRMPSREQQEELINNCTILWTQQKGVDGNLVTGPSGGGIFLPYAGSHHFDHYEGAGHSCGLWSSTLGSRFDTYAFLLGFYYDSGSCGDNLRSVGYSVRAVCP